MTTKRKAYYTKIFGQVMEIIPVYYEFENDEHLVYVLADIQDENVQMVRMGVNMVATHRRGFKPNNYSKQRLGIHFQTTLPYVPKESVTKSTQIPTMQVIQDVLAKGSTR